MTAAVTSTAALPASPAVSTELVRLYISPFTPALISTFLPETTRAVAEEIEYHSFETLPERSYGYVNLPIAEAVKLKKKLNGSILKGMKLRVEDARPDVKKRRVESELENENSGTSTEDKAAVRRSKRTKKQDGVLPGVELEGGRHVKRGWKSSDAESGTRKKSSKEARRRKEEDKGDLVFRTNASSNTASNVSEQSDEAGKGKKRKRDDKSDRVTEVKEFQNTSKFPTFLRDSNAASTGKAAAVAYEDGKGWVDEQGNVVDQYVPPSKGKSPTPAISIQEPEDDENGTVTDEIKISKEKSPEIKISKERSPDVALTATSNTSLKATPEADTPAKVPSALEAIFKRPAPKAVGGKGKGKGKPILPTPIDTSFTFFGDGDAVDSDGEEEEESSLRVPPHTPYTRRDMEHRGVRSAAPTPDTAAIGKHFKLPWAGESDEDEDDTRQGSVDRLSQRKSATPSAPQKSETEVPTEGSAEQTDFEKHFYEHRGEYNRHWKQRKREARKAVRQSENRKRGTRA